MDSLVYLLKKLSGGIFFTPMLPACCATARWWKAIKCIVRGFLSSKGDFFSFLGAAEGLPTLVQVAMLIAAAVLSLTALGIFLACRKCSCSLGMSL